MRKLVLQILTFVILSGIVLLISLQPGYAESVEGRPIVAPVAPQIQRAQPARLLLPLPPRWPPVPANPAADSVLSTACALRPERSDRRARPDRSPVRAQLPLSRFRKGAADKQAAAKAPKPPPEEIALAHPTNFGQRFLQDIKGQAVQNEPILVLHETVGSAEGTIGFFQTAHPDDDDQVSYHALIKLDGTIVYLVPPDQRAFGAGNSVFESAQGREAVQTNPDFPPSVNNFAYHISLVTPPDGRNNRLSHSGYTQLQYQSLAWLVAKTGIPPARMTTHKDVDRSRQRMDPRSFDQAYFLKLLATYPMQPEISIRCTPPNAQREGN
jgi:N-acetylmuramoyl-L-alanine amidase